MRVNTLCKGWGFYAKERGNKRLQKFKIKKTINKGVDVILFRLKISFKKMNGYFNYSAFKY